MLNKTVVFPRVYIVLIVSALVLGLVLVFISRVIYLKNERRHLIMTDIEDYDVKDENDAYDKYMNIKMQEENILRIREKVKSRNQYQPIINELMYANVMSRTQIIVIQVDKNVEYLKILLKSLETVAGITKSLIIFSHNVYDDNINALIETIDFVRYTQIFYPYSSQLHPNIFPSDDSTFCNENYKCEKSTQRDANLAQIKHHWWWTVNQVFDHMKITKYYNGYILFLDEKQYATYDFLYTFKQLVAIRKMDCPQCELLCLGCHRPDESQFSLENSFDVIEPFGSTEYNKGIAFNRTVWNIIKRLRTHFCYHNDSDWESSLRFLASKTSQRQFLMLSTSGPRIFQTEACGDSDREIECKLEDRLDEITSLLKRIRRGMFPKYLKTIQGGQNSTSLTEQGNWEDVRDQELCMFMASKTRLRFFV